MLRTLTDDGNMTYACHNGCGVQSAHVSQVKQSGQLVALPPCPACGSRMFLKVAFTEEELRAPNMIHPLPGLPTASRAVAERHMQLANLLSSSREGT